MRINDNFYRTVWFENGKVCLINQPLLPHEFEVVRYDDYRRVDDAAGAASAYVAAPPGSPWPNPAFDVTPGELLS